MHPGESAKIFSCLLLGLAAHGAWGQASGSASQFPVVRLGGILGSKALLVIDNRPPKAVAIGQSIDGIKLISLGKEDAVIEVNGMKENLRIGESPVGIANASKSESANGQRIVLQAGRGGHYFANGQINGQYAQFLVDTGATAVSLSTTQADAMGISYRNGRLGRAHTANGPVNTYNVTLDSVRVGQVTLHAVEALIVDSSMQHILLGNSFLSRFDMQQSGGQLVLEKRY